MPATAVRRPAAQQQRVSVPPIPFTAAAHEHVEQITLDNGPVIGAAQAQRGPFDVNSFGFLASILLEVTLSGGTLGAGALAADYPFNVLQNITLSDVNGAPIFGPLDGWATLMTNVFGGYEYRQDPRITPQYVGTINSTFYLRIPIQITRHNGYGALANQNAAASYRLAYTLNTAAAAFATAPTTAPAVTIRAHLEAWSQPNETDLTGRPQMTEPPGHGTTQFWSSFTKSNIGSGQQNILLPRVGNMLRCIVCVCRDASGARADNVFPDPVTISWDARQLTTETQRYRIAKAMGMIQAPAARDVGIFAFPFNSLVLGHAGDEEPNLWLPTVQSTRFSFDGVNGANGSIQFLVNDIAPVEVRPEERYVETSATGFHPAVGAAPAVG